MSLLEIVFGIVLAWAFAGETPAPAVLAGGSLVLAALAGNELLGLHGRRSLPAGRTQPQGVVGAE